MRVLMLGWEFPPFITGGLGTACYGLTKALARHGAQVVFVLPKPIACDYASHVRLLAPQAPRAAEGDTSPAAVASIYEVPGLESRYEHSYYVPGVIFKAVPSRIRSPYQSAGGKSHAAPGSGPGKLVTEASESTVPGSIGFLGASAGPAIRHASELYAGNLMQETQRYARLALALVKGEEFDVIHAHDWMTYPAGLAIAGYSGKPLVVHVHSTEFDRSGEHVNQPVYDLERRGMHGAIRIIAVSHLTKSIIVHRYGIDPAKVEVVYNGIDTDGHLPVVPRTAIRRGDKIVLFLGRITWQKGPEFFIRAAKKVLEKFHRVKFVMAGSGDMVQEIIELAAAEGIGQKIIFTGFLHGPDVERVFKLADVYVMPSISEPFGIAPLEAIRHDVPIIISKTSGVAEVITHALKVDFWDIEDMADKIIAVLRHPPLSSTLREHADMELRSLTWDAAAAQCVSAYANAIASMPV